MELTSRLGFTNGCFDVLTSAHVRLFQFARQRCDRLVVGVNDDAGVMALKGGLGRVNRPVNRLADRMIVLRSLRCVDEVVSFHEKTPLRLIMDLHPDVLVKGGDYAMEQIVGAEFVRARGGEVVIFPFIEGQSSTRSIGARA